MNSLHLVRTFAACREANEPLVMVTVFETLGSTYSKAGTRMLITAAGSNEGLVSGGCLEGDLAERARQVLESGRAMRVTYDMRDEADELFGLGIGCNGLISVLLQPLVPEEGYEPMASIAETLLADEPGALATVVAAGSSELACGATAVLGGGGSDSFGVPERYRDAFGHLARETLALPAARLARLDEEIDVLLAPLTPVPRVLILGAGLDALPLVNVLAELGWRVTLADHRPAYLERPGFDRAEARVGVVAGSIGEALDPARFDAIVIMSHHLATDREYLRELASCDARYLGLLGPPARKQRLLADLGPDGERLARSLRGPVGIDIGADSAESIAVAIAAEIQSVLVGTVTAV